MSQDDLEPGVARTDGLLSLEQQVLDEYRQLANKLYALSNELALMNRSISEPSSAESSGDADALLTNMRGVERKMGLVYTLFKTAVYSLVLQSQEKSEEWWGAGLKLWKVNLLIESVIGLVNAGSGTSDTSMPSMTKEGLQRKEIPLTEIFASPRL